MVICDYVIIISLPNDLGKSFGPSNITLKVCMAECMLNRFLSLLGMSEVSMTEENINYDCRNSYLNV